MDESQKIAAVGRLVQSVVLMATTAEDDPNREQYAGYLANALGKVLELVLFRRPTDDELAACLG